MAKENAILTLEFVNAMTFISVIAVNSEAVPPIVIIRGFAIFPLGSVLVMNLSLVSTVPFSDVLKIVINKVFVTSKLVFVRATVASSAPLAI